MSPDPFGLSWQIGPRRFIELVRDQDARKVKAVMEALMTMVKLDVFALERAYDEAYQCHTPPWECCPTTRRLLVSPCEP